jgi:deazaflavin-dependent oxidoreductase (nitroreductase family)
MRWRTTWWWRVISSSLSTAQPSAPSHRGPEPRQRLAALLFRLLGPLVRLAIRRGSTAGPNVLVTVRGRATGRPRSTPVAMLELGEVRYLQASFGITNWVRNLRAAGEATVSRGDWSEAFDVVELTPETAGPLLHDALAPFHRSRLLRVLLGPTVRPPAAILHRHRFRVDETEAEYVAEARRHPLFELRPKPEAVPSAHPQGDHPARHRRSR